MAERELVLQRLKKKRQIYLRRRGWLWALVIVECVLLLIFKSDRIPIVGPAISGIKTFIGELLWPNSMTDLGGGTYGAYLLLVGAWLEELPFYPVVKMVIPQIPPIWLMITYIQSWITNIRIRNLSKPPKEQRTRPVKAEKKKKESTEFGVSVGPKVGGLSMVNKVDADRSLKRLQEACRKMREEAGIDSWELDSGLWVSNRMERGKLLPDKIWSWGNGGVIDMDIQNDFLHFQLYNDGVRLSVDGGSTQTLKKGVPLVIRHRNEAGNEIVDMTVTWLGGAQND